jgi:hypothetical protein
MTQETAKERIENEIKSVDKRLHRGRNYGKTYNTGVKEGLMIARAHIIDSLTTDKLSVEKLQEIRVEELKDFNSKILQAELKNQELQEQLNTAKKYIEHVIGTIKHDGHLGTIQTDWILPDLEKALAAIGGDDER